MIYTATTLEGKPLLNGWCRTHNIPALVYNDGSVQCWNGDLDKGDDSRRHDSRPHDIVLVFVSDTVPSP